MTAQTQAAGRRPKKTILGASLLAGAGLLAGIGAFAAFTDTESVTRSVDAGQLDITVEPDFAEVNNMAPGDIWSHPLEISLPEAHNDGDLIDRIQVVAQHDDDQDTWGQHMDNGVEGPDGSSSLFSGNSGLRVYIQNCVGGTWDDLGDGLWDCDGGTVEDVVGAAGGLITGPASLTGDGVKLNEFTGLDGVHELDADDFGVTPTPDTGTIPDGSSLNLLMTFAFPGLDNQYGADEAADNSYENADLSALVMEFTAIQRDGIER